MFVYLGIYSCLALSAVGNYRRPHAIFFLFSGIFLVWFMGFRYEVGCDYLGYFNRWLNFNSELKLVNLFQGEEFGFALIMGSIKASGLGYTWLNVAASAILVVCYVRFSRDHPLAPLLLTLLFPVVIIQLGMSGLRHRLAGGFLMLSSNAFGQKKKIRTAAWILLGMQFHTSVIIFLPIAFLAGKDFNTLRIFLAMLILGPITALLLAGRFDTYESRYIENTVTSSGAVIRYVLTILPVPFFIIHRHKLKAIFPEIFPLLKLSSLIILSLAPLIMISTIALHRLIFYIMPLSIILCVYLATVMSKKISQAQWFPVIAYGAYSIAWFISSKHAQACYVPYGNTWIS